LPIGVAVHGNPVHPDKKIAADHAAAHRDAVLLAAELGTCVINFSGCPGGAPGDKTPNFVTCPWPTEFSQAADYQWNKVIIPFWKKENDFAAKHGVKIAFEAHPGMTVHNPEDIVRLRNAAGKNLGANLDPSHFFWQGICPVAAARFLGENKCIFHVHAKDCAIDPANSSITGNLDIKSYGDVAHRSWVFRTVGYGHGDDFWKPFISMLRLQGYDGVLSIEHEDSLMSLGEGFEKAVSYLKGVMLTQKTGQAWWF
jgi:sugar phosphate isomerase/epimerase